jgi:hypothetical protein
LKEGDLLNERKGRDNTRHEKAERKETVDYITDKGKAEGNQSDK